jgi:hypothetical protein
MFALPLRKITASGDTYLLTLVDQRFFWWGADTGNLSVNEGTTTWADLVSDLASQLGISITQDSVSGDYYTPADTAGVKYEPVPPWLDAILFACGQRLTCDLDGTVFASNAPGELPLTSIDTTSGGQGLNLTGDSAPAEVNIVVPRRIALSYTNQKWLKTSAGTGLGGTFTFFPPFAAVAVDTTSTPTNDTQLQTYADRFTLDLCQWLSAELVDIRYAGIVSVDPDPSYGNITWTYRQDQLSTRVQPTNYPWRPFPFPVTADNFTWSGRIVQVPSTTLTPSSDITALDMNGGTLADITPSADIHIKGITDSSMSPTTPFVGQLAEIRNLSSSHKITLDHNSGSVSAGEKMMLPDSAAQEVAPHTTAVLKYTPSSDWQIIALFCCIQTNPVINWTGATITLTSSTFTVTGGTFDLSSVATLKMPGSYQMTGNKGDLPYLSATDTLSLLPIGSTGQVLTVVSGLPAWQSPSSSGAIQKNFNLTGQAQNYTSTPSQVPGFSITSTIGFVGLWGSLVNVGPAGTLNFVMTDQAGSTFNVNISFSSSSTTSFSQSILDGGTTSAIKPIKTIDCNIISGSTPGTYNFTAVFVGY